MGLRILDLRFSGLGLLGAAILAVCLSVSGSSAAADAVPGGTSIHLRQRDWNEQLFAVDSRWSASNGVITATMPSPERVVVTFTTLSNPNEPTAQFTFAAPEGNDLDVRSYDRPTSLTDRYFDRPAFEALVKGNATTPDAAFNILELVKTADGELTRFRAVFRKGYAGASGAVFGEVRFNSAQGENQPPTVTAPKPMFVYPGEPFLAAQSATDPDPFYGVNGLRLRAELALDSPPLSFVSVEQQMAIQAPGTYRIKVIPDDGLDLGESVIQEVNVLPAASRYRGSLTDSNGAIVGPINLILTENRTFTGTLVLDGSVARLHGFFDDYGVATVTATPQGGSPFDLTLEMSADGNISGSAVSGESTFHVAVSPYGQVVLPKPFPGFYTFLLTSAPQNPSVPSGSGFGLMIINKSADVRLICVLPDGKTWSSGTFLSNGGLNLDRTLYNARGYLRGSIGGRALDYEGGDFHGQLEWSRPPSLHFAGWTTFLQLDARRFVPLRRQHPIFDASSAIFAAFGSDGQEYRTNVAIQRRNKLRNVGPGLEQLNIRSDGLLVSGTWRDPVTLRRRYFSGILMQDPDYVEGFFRGADQEGVWRLVPRR